MLSPRENKILKETRLRNLKRKYAKLSYHPEFMDECQRLQSEIHTLENELS